MRNTWPKMALEWVLDLKKKNPERKARPKILTMKDKKMWKIVRMQTRSLLQLLTLTI
jgi:hypothetical protein